jgi:hypothetical protein
MECVCKGKTKVVSIKNDDENGISYRKRKCTECEMIFYTKEEYVYDSEEFMELWESI